VGIAELGWRISICILHAKESIWEKRRSDVTTFIRERRRRAKNFSLHKILASNAKFLLTLWGNDRRRKKG